MADAVPGYEVIGEGSPAFYPAGPEFAPYLASILGQGSATHWTTLTENTAATVAHHGRGFLLAGYTLNLDPAASLEAGWRGVAVGPGTIQPDTGEGDAVVLSDDEWAQIGSDGASNPIIMKARGGRCVAASSVAGTPIEDEEVLGLIHPDAVFYPEDFAGSYAIAGIAATAETVFDVQKNGSSIGSITFAISGDTGVFDVDGGASFAAGDIITVVAPSAPDATLADIKFSLRSLVL